MTKLIPSQISGSISDDKIIVKDDNTTFREADSSDFPASSQVQSNWNESDTNEPSFIVDKPENLSDFNNDIGAGDMLSTNNLSDVSSIQDARDNLDVYSQSEVDGLIPTPLTGGTGITISGTVVSVNESGIDYTQLDNLPTLGTMSAESTSDYYDKSDIDGKGYITDISGKEDKSNKGVANGYASLDSSGRVLSSQIPDIAITQFLGNFLDVATGVADSGVQASERGDWFTTDDDKTYIVISDGPTTVGDVKPLKTPTGGVSSVNGDSGVVVLDKNDIGLGNVPNTDFTSIISNKVDKVVGMGLSQESYTSSEQSKLSGIEALADVTNATNVSAAGAVMKTGAQTIAGVKTFSSSPIIPEPTTNLQAATKKYVDDSVSNLGIGDMLASVYDPNNIAEDAFDRANHTGTQTASTISNFSTAVSSNGAVTANTEKEPGVSNFGYLNIPQNSKNSNYTLVLGDAGKHIYNDGTTARTRTIPANASVAFPIGTTITFVNDSDKDMTLAITTDTLVWTDDGTTGTRIVKPQGMATIMKVTATRRFISGVNVE